MLRNTYDTTHRIIHISGQTFGCNMLRLSLGIHPLGPHLRAITCPWKQAGFVPLRKPKLVT